MITEEQISFYCDSTQEVTEDIPEDIGYYDYLYEYYTRAWENSPFLTEDYIQEIIELTTEIKDYFPEVENVEEKMATLGKYICPGHIIDIGAFILVGCFFKLNEDDISNYYLEYANNL